MKTSEFLKNFRRRANSWVPRQSKRSSSAPNATEAKFLREILTPLNADGKLNISYQPMPIVITKTTGREYTADYLVQDSRWAEMKPTYFEVKGNYISSKDGRMIRERSRLAWEIAAELHPEYDFVWAELTRRGWEIERWESGGKRIYVKLAGETDFILSTPDWRRHKPRKPSSAASATTRRKPIR